MNRRGFLKCLGAFAAGAALPVSFRGALIARAPAWAKEVMLYSVSEPLAAGNYTFTAYVGDLGVYFGTVRALGGEILFEIPKAGHPMENPRLKRGGVYVAFEDGSLDLCDERTRDNMIRGDEVRPV